MNKPVRKEFAKVWTKVVVQRTKDRSVEFSWIQILEEDVQTVPVLPHDGPIERGCHLLLPCPGLGLRGPDGARSLQPRDISRGHHQLQDGGHVTVGTAGPVSS